MYRYGRTIYGEKETGKRIYNTGEHCYVIESVQEFTNRPPLSPN